MRPPTDLTPVAARLRFCATVSAFGQRLVFERVMAERFPGIKRRDLKPAVYLCLDATERFPRVTVEPRGGGRAGCFGPFRDRPSAEKASHALHKLFPLRPCDFRFEPDPELSVGVGCLYAQVRSCAAPCLARVTEDDYRGLAREAARLLSTPSGRPADTASWLRPFVASAAVRAVVIEPARGATELYPVVAGTVGVSLSLPGAATPEAIDAAIPTLDWSAPARAGQDEPWLAAWLWDKKRRGDYRVLESV